MTQVNELLNKWGPVLDHEAPGLSKIADKHRRYITATMLENTTNDIEGHAQFMNMNLLSEAAPTNHTGSNISNFDPVLISLVRRAMPNLMAYDVMGVQPMTGPTGLIFALRSRYTSQSGTEAFYNEANTAFATVRAGNSTIGESMTGTAPDANTSNYNFAGAMSTAQAEALGTSGNTAFAEMGLSIEKVTVSAGSRALKAEYTIELAQDLKAIHGLDAESELASILSTEILAEINREAVRTIYISAQAGAQNDVANTGTFDLDVDSNGRWLVEKFKGLMYQIEREANQISKNTRRGKGNIIICSSDVASALSMAGLLDYAPALQAQTNMQVDDTGNTFAGILNQRFRVYIDPYATSQYLVVGYKGANPMDAGIFYCPYVPLQMVRAVDPNSFQPKIGFKTRYGMVANPFAQGTTQGLGAINAGTNVYYRRVTIANLL